MDTTKLTTILANNTFSPLLPIELQYGKTLVLDMTGAEWADAAEQPVEVLIARTQQLMQTADAVMAVGRYAEDRANLYSRSALFKDQQSGLRSVHLGIDLTVPAGTPLTLPLAGKLHSYADNDNFGDYGPTIIMQHELQGVQFFTLYGHLSRGSLAELQVGTAYQAGEPFARVGDVDENGGWPPHLHFQIIQDLQGYKGGYPGVISPVETEAYLKNCPDPNLILKLASLS